MPWLSTLSALQNAHEALLKSRFLGLTPRDSDSVPPGCNSISDGPDGKLKSRILSPVVKDAGYGGRLARVHIPRSAPSRCVTWGKLFNLLSLSFHISQTRKWHCLPCKEVMRKKCGAWYLVKS